MPAGSTRGSAASEVGVRLVIAGSRPWNRHSFEAWARRQDHETWFVSAPAELDAGRIGTFAPDYVFFIHWSWKIPAELYEPLECIGFHMTDLPFGRGGSPLQNLIVRGIRETRLSAFRVSAKMDAGPIYLKRPLSLEGRAGDIFVRASDLAFRMIDEIVERRIVPVPQQGQPVVFQRRTPGESRLPESSTLDGVYDFIRMLDAEGYPQAFIEHGAFRLEFTGAQRTDDAVTAHVRIVAADSEKDS